MTDKEIQLRLAWHLSCCFQEDSGRPRSLTAARAPTWCTAARGSASPRTRCSSRPTPCATNCKLKHRSAFRCDGVGGGDPPGASTMLLDVPLVICLVRGFLREGGKASASGCLQGGEVGGRVPRRAPSPPLARSLCHVRTLLAI
uniref:Uncharacterized protein n=1 Tax=Oryza meridionalis TaxID=40149 RepID=A0A0E0CFM5_9ORYZ